MHTEVLQDATSKSSRRQVLRWLSACIVPVLAGRSGEAADLPLNTTGLEHFGMTVPDPEAAAKFYGGLFDPQLFREREPPPRFYVRLGTGYLAFGGGQNATPSIDHFCVLVPDYQPQEMRTVLEAAGVPMGNGPLGMATDPDGFRLQLLGVPGGLARTVVPAYRTSQDDALFQAVGPHHVMLHVSNLDQSVEHYRKLFGAEMRTRKPERAWFTVARTKLGLEAISAGEKPSVHHVAFRVAGFDRRAAAEKLERAGIGVVAANEENVVQFRDPNGLAIELLAG